MVVALDVVFVLWSPGDGGCSSSSDCCQIHCVVPTPPVVAILLMVLSGNASCCVIAVVNDDDLVLLVVTAVSFAEMAAPCIAPANTKGQQRRTPFVSAIGTREYGGMLSVDAVFVAVSTTIVWFSSPRSV